MWFNGNGDLLSPIVNINIMIIKYDHIMWFNENGEKIMITYDGYHINENCD